MTQRTKQSQSHGHVPNNSKRNRKRKKLVSSSDESSSDLEVCSDDSRSDEHESKFIRKQFKNAKSETGDRQQTKTHEIIDMTDDNEEEEKKTNIPIEEKTTSTRSSSRKTKTTSSTTSLKDIQPRSCKKVTQSKIQKIIQKINQTDKDGNLLDGNDQVNIFRYCYNCLISRLRLTFIF
jgi:hypothetical protein